MTGKTFSIAEQELSVPDSDIRLEFVADPADYSRCILRVHNGSERYLEAVFNRNGGIIGEPAMVGDVPPPEPEPAAFEPPPPEPAPAEPPKEPANG